MGWDGAAHPLPTSLLGALAAWRLSLPGLVARPQRLAGGPLESRGGLAGEAGEVGGAVDVEGDAVVLDDLHAKARLPRRFAVGREAARVTEGREDRGRG